MGAGVFANETSELERQHRRREIPWIWVALGFLILVQLAPVWGFRYLVTQDGAAHVENGVILRDLVLGRESMYSVNREPVPNWVGHGLLAAFSLGVTPRVAEKLLVSLYVVLLPLCAAYAGRSVRRGGEWVGVLVVPFVYSLALHKGLYNFCLSLAGFFLLVGMVVRAWGARPSPLPSPGVPGEGEETKERFSMGDAPSPRPSAGGRGGEDRDAGVAPTVSLGRVGLIGGVALLVYFSHVVSLVMAVIVLGGLGLGVLVMGRGARWRDVGNIFVGIVPALGLVVWFFLSSRGAEADRRDVGVQLLRFFELDALASFRKPELLVGIGYSAVLWGVTLLVLVRKALKREWVRWDWVLSLVVVTLGVYLAAPNSAAGGGQISFRLSLYPYFVLMLWLAGQRLGWMTRAGASAAAAGVCLLFLVLHWGSYARLNVYLKEYESVGNHMVAGRSVMALDTSRDSAMERKISWRVRPFWHAMGYVAARRGLVDLGNYEIEMGYFPVVFTGIISMRSGTDYSDDPFVEEERELMARAADYIVVWDLAGKGTLKDPFAAELLQREYEVVYRSGHRWATVYRKKAR